MNPVKKQIELSLRLSHVDPAAAKKRRREERWKGQVGKKIKVAASTSDGESVEIRYGYISLLPN